MNRYLTALLVALTLSAAPPAMAQNCTDCTTCGEGVAAGGRCAACRAGYPCQQCGCHGGAGCIDCPTPGACTADGICYPKRNTWGHYQGGWSRWPGDYDDPLPAGVRARGDGDLPGVLIEIPKTEEDLQAPPSSDAEEEGENGESTEDEGPGVGASLPPLLPTSPLTTPPGGLSNPPRGPAPGGPAPGGNDPPPSLPPLPGFNRPLSTPPGGGIGSGDGFSRVRPLPPTRRTAAASDRDLPPTLPAGFGVVLPASATGQGAAHTATPLGALPTPAAPVHLR